MDSYISKKFGYEWSVYKEIIPSHRDQFLGWISPLSLDAFKEKRFLDAGCGIGRNSLWPLLAGASSGVAFDFDERTVQVARDNLRSYPQCEVTYRSIYDLSFKDEFDIIFCIGVIHHLERPRDAIQKLIDAAKPGARVILWVYAQEGNREFLAWFNPLRIHVTSKLSFSVNRWIAILFTVCLKIYLALRRSNQYMNLLQARSFRHTEAMVLDQLIPAIANYWTKEEVVDLITNPQVEIESLTHTNQMSWTVIMKKKL